MTTDTRRSQPGARFIRCDTVTGRLVKLTANDLGVITIESDEERRVADAIGLPITKIPRASNDEVAKLRKERT